MIHVYKDFDTFYKEAKASFSDFGPSETDALAARQSKYVWFSNDNGFHWCHVNDRCKYCNICNKEDLKKSIRELKLRRLLDV